MTLTQKEKIRRVVESNGEMVDILEGEKIKRSLYLDYCTSLTHLPEGLEAEEWIVLEGCIALEHVPDTIKASKVFMPDGWRTMTSYMKEGE